MTTIKEDIPKGFKLLIIIVIIIISGVIVALTSCSTAKYPNNVEPTKHERR